MVPLVLVADRAEMPLGRLSNAGDPSTSPVVAFPAIVDTFLFTRSTARIRLFEKSVIKSVPSAPSAIKLFETGCIRATLKLPSEKPAVPPKTVDTFQFVSVSTGASTSPRTVHKVAQSHRLAGFAAPRQKNPISHCAPVALFEPTAQAHPPGDVQGAHAVLEGALEKRPAGQRIGALAAEGHLEPMGHGAHDADPADAA